MSCYVEVKVAPCSQSTEIECEAHGKGEWPGVADASPPIAEGFPITCATVLTPDAMFGAGPVSFTWVIADGADVDAQGDV